MLNQRLGDPKEAVTNATIATVLFLIHESIVTGNVDHTKTHMDGIEMMLGTGNFTPNPMVQEILFWTDLLGSASTHTPFRSYASRPPTATTRLHCLPIFLYRTTLSSLCVGFQPFLIDTVFEPLIDPLHEIRCLTMAFHFSSCQAHLELPLLTRMCSTIAWCLHHVQNESNSPVFEAYKLTSILFVALVLLGGASDTMAQAEELQATLQHLSLREASSQVKKMIVWILFIGCVATLETELESRFLEWFMCALVVQGLRSLRALRTVLLEYFWVDGFCDYLLVLILEKQMLKYSEMGDTTCIVYGSREVLRSAESFIG